MRFFFFNSFSALFFLILPSPNYSAKKTETQDTEYVQTDNENVVVDSQEAENKNENVQESIESLNQESVKEDVQEQPEIIVHDINEYIGYWGITGSQEEELTIHSVSGDSVVFSIWYYRLASVDYVTVLIDGNKATFSNDEISGELTFGDEVITVDIFKSDVAYIPEDSQIFNDHRTGSVSGTKLEMPQYILPNSSNKLITTNDLILLSAEELRIARNEIFARHGRKFSDQALQAYFDSQEWYTGIYEPNQFSEDMLNDIEKQNIQIIKEFESKVNN